MLEVTNVEHWQDQLDVRIVSDTLCQAKSTSFTLADFVRHSESLVEDSVRERGAVLGPVQVALVSLKLTQRDNLLRRKHAELDVLPASPIRPSEISLSSLEGSAVESGVGDQLGVGRGPEMGTKVQELTAAWEWRR